jgi:hypothetical protein
MAYQSLTLLLNYLVESEIVSQDKRSTVYNFIQKRLFKQRGFASVIYEVSDFQTIIITRDATTYLFSVEIITAATELQVAQPVQSQVVILPSNVVPLLRPFVPRPVPPVRPVSSLNSPVVHLSLTEQLVLDIPYDIDFVKAAAYKKLHTRPRVAKKEDNSVSSQLAFNFDNVVYAAVRFG